MTEFWQKWDLSPGYPEYHDHFQTLLTIDHRVNCCNTLVFGYRPVVISKVKHKSLSGYPSAKLLALVRQWPLQSLKVFLLLFCGLRTLLLCTSPYLRAWSRVSIGRRSVTLWVNISLS